MKKSNSSNSLLSTKTFQAPYSQSFLHRLSAVGRQREEKEKQKETDPFLSRSNSSLSISTSDLSKLHSANRTFGLIKPVTPSRGRSRSVSRDRSLVVGDDSSNSSNNFTTEGNCFHILFFYLDSNNLFFLDNLTLPRLRRSLSLTRSSSTSSVSQFQREMDIQRNITAEEQQKQALLLARKEAHLQYFKNKSKYISYNYLFYFINNLYLV